MDDRRHIISLLVENEFGSLSRIAGLFSARGYNIHCLNVAPTNDESISRMTLVTLCNDQKISQLMKQLNKLVDVVNVKDLTEETHIEREMLLMKLKCNKSHFTSSHPSFEGYGQHCWHRWLALWACFSECSALAWANGTLTKPN